MTGKDLLRNMTNELKRAKELLLYVYQSSQSTTSIIHA